MTYPFLIMSGGAEIRNFWPLYKSVEKVDLKYVRGQNIIFQQQRTRFDEIYIEETSKRSIHAILCGEYFVPSSNGNGGIIGATHEYDESMLASKPNLGTASSLLYPKISKMLDIEQNTAQVLSSKCNRVVCGNRVSSPRTHLGKLPMVGNVFDNVWLVTGMGSRGLLHHAYVAKILSAAIVRQESIPVELDYNKRQTR